MKKSKKPEITPEQILGDYNKIMEFVNKLEGQDLTNINLKEKFVKGEYLSQPKKRKIKFKDSVTGKTFGFKDLESYMENNIGKDF